MALYHKYRPQTFASVTGQTHIIQTITNQIRTASLGHAYMFSGPRGVGKTTTARLIAKAVNCEKRKKDEAEPCNTCSSCEEITAGRSLDVVEIDAASNTGVDHVREHIIDNARFRPTKSVYKVFIIDEVHMLSTSAFNALLKTLEEPPSHVLFILATTELHKIPETVLSRCQRFQFKKMPFTDMHTHLLDVAKKEGITIDEEPLTRIIGKSDGCVRDAMSILDQLMAIGTTHITSENSRATLPLHNLDLALHFLEATLQKRPKDALTILDDADQSGVSWTDFADDAVTIMRLMCIGRVDGDTTEVARNLPSGTTARAVALGKTQSAPELVRFTEALLRARNDISKSPVAQLPLELLAIVWGETNDRVETHETPREHAAVPTPLATPTQKKAVASTNIPETPASPPHVSPQTTTPIAEVAPEPPSTRAPFSHEEHLPALSFDSAKAMFKNMVKALESKSPSLVSVLHMAEVIRTEGRALTISVPYAFHKDTLGLKGAKQTLDKAFHDHFGGRVELVVEVPDQNAPPDADLSAIADAFGGQFATP